MAIRVFILLVCLSTATLGQAQSLDKQSDRQLKNLCFRWFMPSLHQDGGDTVANSWARKALEKLPRSKLITRLQSLQEHDIHCHDYGAISFALAYWGVDDVKNARRMVGVSPLSDTREQYLNVDMNVLNSPYKEMRDQVSYPFSAAYAHSLVQLYVKRKNPSLMTELLRWRTDGESSIVGARVRRQLFALAPVVYLDAALAIHADEVKRGRWPSDSDYEGIQLCYEASVKEQESLIRTLKVLLKKAKGERKRAIVSILNYASSYFGS